MPDTANPEHQLRSLLVRTMVLLCFRYVAHAIMLRSGSFAAPDMMNLHFLRNIICCATYLTRCCMQHLWRNSIIEDIHAGLVPVTRTGD